MLDGSPRANVPHLRTPDSTLAFLREGYPFIQRRVERLNNDVFIGRLVGRKAVFLTGPLAAELFYDNQRFARAGALPSPIKKTLFGVGGVQELDDAAHQHRKALFMAALSGAQVARLVNILSQGWFDALEDWHRRGRICLFDEASVVLCNAACTWAGIPISPSECADLARDCVMMVDGFATLSLRHVRARTARKRAEQWARNVIRQVRDGSLNAPQGSPARLIAEHRELQGQHLPIQVAAVELLNIIRPTVAMAWLVAFAGLSLHDYPEYEWTLREDPTFIKPYVKELRRFYPFTPCLGAKARGDFEWSGVRFRRGELAVLDVYGMLHDERWWDNPRQFRPERFLDGENGPFDFIPNGGGDVSTGHRCAGEILVERCLEQVVHLLSQEIWFDFPTQDFRYSLSRIPTRPQDGVVLSNVRVAARQPLNAPPRQPPLLRVVSHH